MHFLHSAARQARFGWLRCASFGVLFIVFFVPLPALASTASTWDIIITPFDQVFPALELSQSAHRNAAQRSAALEKTGAKDARGAGAEILGDGSGLVAVQVKALRDNEHVHLTISASPWLREATVFDATLATTGTTYELHPPLAWNVARLRRENAPVATQLQFELQRDHEPAQTRNVAISLRPLNEALYFVRDGRDSVDLAWIFAAYVDENDSVIDNLLEVARQSGIVTDFSGYTDADGEAVKRQAWAIWHALNVRGIRYSGADPGIDRGPHVFSQRVRFIKDTWNDRSANCIDGSALLASALQRIGVRTFLVLVPGHAFIGFYLDADSQKVAYLETTFLGQHVAEAAKTPFYAQSVTLNASLQSSLASFDAALRAGASRHARDASKFDGKHRPDFAIIDISAARGFGIQPIDSDPKTNQAGGQH